MQPTFQTNPFALFMCLMCLISSTLSSQNCNCDYTIAPIPDRLNVYDPSDFPGIGPGSTICLQSGTHGALRFNTIIGASGNPITIINCGGRATINAQAVNYGAIGFNGSQ